VGRIAKRITEAYAVLRDPRRRQAYDRMRDAGGGARMQLAEAEAGARRQAQENEGRTPQGRQYYSRARADLAREDWAAAARNLQTALTFEPQNAFFKQTLEEVRARLK
jgi:DnaJ-class molecular chaperone